MGHGTKKNSIYPFPKENMTFRDVSALRTLYPASPQRSFDVNWSC